jgi:hypothetical protein
MCSSRTALWAGSIILLLTCGCQQSRPNQVNRETDSQQKFHWLDSGRDVTVWNSVQAAFRQELAPDDPAKLDPHRLAYEHKYLHQIGIFKTAALVILGYGETKAAPGDVWFNAFSYDLSTGLKHEIVAEQRTKNRGSDVLWEFNVERLAQFEQSPVPDVAFTYSDCTECEGEHFLASFEYDPDRQAWTARQWGKESSLLLAADPSPGDYVQSSEYLFKIKDWDGDGFDDVAVRRREVTLIAKRSQVTEDSTTIYKAESRTLVGHPITDLKKRAGINAELCNDSKLTFCKQHK